MREISLEHYHTWRSGKVREIFDLGEHLLFVATDRVSAFDVVLPNTIPGKGIALTQLSRFWFDRTQHIVPNHNVDASLEDLNISATERELLEGRAMIVHKAERIDVECVVRNRITGSGWREYQETGTLAGIKLPSGLREGDTLPDLQFTPAIKNDEGHDENISFEALTELLSRNLAELLSVTSKALLHHAERIARSAGFTIADTKFEFGFIDGRLVLIDEVLTPDSSRYWDLAELQGMHVPEGYDKQVIRDWLTQSGWNHEPPAPAIPDAVAALALERYEQVLRRLQATEARESGGNR